MHSYTKENKKEGKINNMPGSAYYISLKFKLEAKSLTYLSVC
jgi:hypothetical protein